MHLDPVKPRRLGILRRLFEASHNARQFIIAQFPRHSIRLLPLRGVHLVISDRQRTRRHRLCPIIEKRMTRPSPMPNLQKDSSSGPVHRVGHRFPPRNLRRRVNSRLRIKGRVSFHRHGGLGNDQSRRGPLRVVFRHKLSRHMLRFGPASGEGSHEQAVGQFHRTHAQRFEQRKQRIHRARSYLHSGVLKSPIYDFLSQTSARWHLFTTSGDGKFLKPYKTINHKDVNNPDASCSTPHQCAFHGDGSL